jgi:sporulation protein YlmC with PRC-barrel domain
MTYRLPLALAALAFGSLPALAQAPSTQQNQTSPPPAAITSPSAPSSSSFMTELKPGMWRAGKLNGVNVYNAQNEKIGDINDVLLDQQGKAQAVVIGVGGFLGMGEHDVAVPFDQIKFIDEPMRSASTTSSPSTAANPPARSTDRGDVTGSTRGGTSSSASSDARRGYPDHALLNMTKDQLKAAPQFRYSTNR